MGTVLTPVSRSELFQSAAANAEADTRHALGEANAKGIATLCVTVGSDTDDAALDRAFGVAARVRVRTVAHLRGPFAAADQSSVEGGREPIVDRRR